MESSSTEPKDPSQQPYVQVSQVDDDSGPGVGGNDAESSPEPRDDPEDDSELKNARGTTVVLGTNARLWTSSVHLLPLALSAFVVVINIQRWYWVDVDSEWTLLVTPEAARSVLQFAAKVHELLVITSLGALTLKLFKRHLIDSHFPLGLLTGAYRVGDIPYVFSRPFWGALSRRRSRFLALILFINTMVATLVGPSSAILLVPELDWYPLPHPFGYVQPLVYYGLAANKTWPRVVSAALLSQDGQLRGCDTFTAWYPFWCPAAGYSDLWAWLSEGRWLSEGQRLDIMSNLTVQDPAGVVRRRLLAEGEWPAQAMTTVSLTPLLTIGRLLNSLEGNGLGTIDKTAMFRLSTSGESTVFQPLVQTACLLSSQSVLVADNLRFANAFRFTTAGLNCLGDPDCEDMLNTPWIMKESYVQNASYSRPVFRFVKPKTTKNHPLLAMAGIPFQNGSAINLNIFGCSIIAHWMPATLSISPGESNLVQSNVTSMLSRFYHRGVAPFSVGPAIKMENDWIDYLAPEMNITLPNGTVQRATLLDRIAEPLFKPFTPGNETVYQTGKPAVASFRSVAEAESYVRTLFGAIVTEGLARVASHSESYMVRSSNGTAVVIANIGIGAQYRALDDTYDWSNGTVVRIDATGAHRVDEDVKTPQQFLDRMAPLTRFEFEAERYGYGSGKVGTSRDFALVVMCMYFFIVGTYFLHVMVMPRLRRREEVPTIVAWGDITGLLLLAWNSKPSPDPKLNQSAVKIETSSTWKVEVAIRAEPTGRTQLVSGDKGVEKLRRNVQYH